LYTTQQIDRTQQEINNMSAETKIIALNEKHNTKVVALRAKHTARIATYENKLNAMIAKLDVRLHVDAQYIRDLADLNEPAVNTDMEGEDDE
jgi:hypothetical protein